MSRYDFRTLSPPDFEELVRDLLQANLGIRLEIFGAGRDLGIDFRFATAGRTTIVQAKHYVDSGFEPLLRAVRLEEPKVRRLTPTRYILATSVSLSPSRKQQLQTLLPSAPLALADIIGREDLNNLLGLHPDVERRHFKLWMSSTAILEQVVHSGLHNRTQSELSEIQSLAPKFVSNDSVPRALSLLEKHGALIISGQPGVGKTTLARILVSMHIDMGWKVSVIDSVADAFASSSPGENRLVFFDDFLGQVRLTPDGLRSVDQRLPSLLHKTKASKAFRFIMTTRDYILHQAREQSDRLSACFSQAERVCTGRRNLHALDQGPDPLQPYLLLEPRSPQSKRTARERLLPHCHRPSQLQSSPHFAVHLRRLCSICKRLHHIGVHGRS